MNPANTTYVEGLEKDSLNGRRDLSSEWVIYLQMVCLFTTASISIGKADKDDQLNDIE